MNRKGFLLTELIVSLLLIGLIIPIFMQLIFKINHYSQKINNRFTCINESLYTFSYLETELFKSKSIVDIGVESIIYNDDENRTVEIYRDDKFIRKRITNSQYLTRSCPINYFGLELLNKNLLKVDIQSNYCKQSYYLYLR